MPIFAIFLFMCSFFPIQIVLGGFYNTALQTSQKFPIPYIISTISFTSNRCSSPSFSKLRRHLYSTNYYPNSPDRVHEAKSRLKRLTFVEISNKRIIRLKNWGSFVRNNIRVGKEIISLWVPHSCCCYTSSSINVLI